MRRALKFPSHAGASIGGTHSVFFPLHSEAELSFCGLKFRYFIRYGESAYHSLRSVTARIRNLLLTLNDLEEIVYLERGHEQRVFLMDTVCSSLTQIVTSPPSFALCAGVVPFNSPTYSDFTFRRCQDNSCFIVTAFSLNPAD